MYYLKTIGRIRVTTTEDGAKQEDYRYGATVEFSDDFNDGVVKSHNVSIEELRDLRYMIDRAIAAVERK